MPEADDLRQFIRDIATRHERIWREQSQLLHATLTGLREVEQGLRDAREESRAQTRALLHVLDRLENGGSAA